MAVIIGLDIDGVLLDIGKLYRDTYAKVNPDEPLLAPEDLTHWPHQDTPGHEVTGERTWQHIPHMYSECYGMAVLPGAYQALQKLRLRNTVLAVTSPTYRGHWVRARTAALTERFGFREDEIMFVKRKQYVDVDALIEDSVQNLYAWCSRHPQRYGYLVDQPWDRHAALLLPNMIRVDSLSAVTELVCQ